MKLQYIVFILAFHASAGAGSLIEEARKSLLPGSEKKFFTTIYEQEKERVAHLKKEKAELLEHDKSFNAAITQHIDQLKRSIASSESVLKQQPDNEVIKKKLEMMLELFQLLNDKKQLRDQIKPLIDEQLKVSQEYLADPDLRKFTASLHADKGEFSFDDDLLKKHEMIMEQEKLVAALSEQEVNAVAELDNRKRAMNATIEAQSKKDKKPGEVEEDGSFGLNQQERTEFNQLRDQLVVDRKSVHELRLQEIEYKLNVIKTKLFIARQQLDILNAAFRTIKQATRVSQIDVAVALDELDKKRQHIFATKDTLRQESESISADLKTKERDLDVMSKRYNIPLDTELDEWSKPLRARAAVYLAFAQVSDLHDDVLLLKRKRELLEAQSALEDERLRSEGLRISVKESFYRMFGRKFATEEEVTKEIKKYDTPRAEAKANLALYKERLNTVSSVLASRKKALENIKERKQAAERIRNTIFEGQDQDYQAYVAALKSAEARVQEEIEVLSKLGPLYADLIALLTNTTKHIDFINTELSSITIWYRPEHAISWTGVKNSIPDLQAFFKDVFSYLGTMHVRGIFYHFMTLFTSVLETFLFIMALLLVIGVLIITRRYLPAITNKLVSLENAPSGVRWVGIVTAILLGFGLRHLLSLIIWFIIFLLLLFHPIPDPYPYILFYLLSIPYLLYLASRLMRYLVHFNSKYDYVFLSKDYQRRFIVVCSVMVYATIVIFFLREAFIMGNYRKSELPTILLAINFIIFQISAILLLSKDQILSLIPTRNDFWLWIHDVVDSSYYLLQLFLIAVIVMSNPYVGYGRLVLYVLKRLLFTAILLQLIFWFNEWLKRSTSRIFFYTDADDEVMRDRFSYAKTWYGMLVVATLLTCTFLGFIIAARIWGWPELLLKVNTWSDVVSWVKMPLLLENTQSPISIYTILRILGFLIAGAIVVFIINRYVLGRIFDILLIDSGVQNTISSLVRYLGIITALIVGFQSVGLGELVWYLIGGLILGIGWVVKDPMADLVAYFIIILQRPIKVGDFIWIDDNTNGVVRRISPRSVELRRKNSTTVVVPNVQVTTRPVSNWNFVRGFVAFDDINLIIPYRHDPAKVREILLRSLDENRMVLKNPRPVVRLESFSELGYVFLVRGYLSSNYTLDMWDVASDVRMNIVKRLREQDIEIASGMRILRNDLEDITIR